MPNVAALPYFAGGALDQRQAQQRLSVGFTISAVNVLTSQGVTVVDLMCDARSYLPSNYSSDFHPNDSGYAFISAEIVNAITSALVPGAAGQLSPDDRGSVTATGSSATKGKMGVTRSYARR